MGKKLLKALIQFLLIVAFFALLVYLTESISFAEETEAYVLCADYVNVRPFPNRKGEPVGRMEAGDRVFTDGKKRNGYLHVMDMGLESDGWIYAGFIVYDEPIKVGGTAVIVSKGRLAARKYVGGRRTRWLKPQATVKVYYWSDDWCVTNCGYVQSKYLELEE